MGITGIPDSYSAFEAWSRAYEEEHMVYAKSNHETALATFDLMLGVVPKPLRGAVYQVILCLLDQRLLTAFGLPNPNPTLQSVVFRILHARAAVLRYLSLPRFVKTANISASLNEHGRYHAASYTFTPYYVKESVFERVVGQVFGWHKDPKYVRPASTCLQT